MALKFPLSLGAICVAVALQAYAEEQTTLDTITVTDTEIKASQIKKTRKVIQEELVADNYDLVRYATDVGISDNGRRNKGFAMRGVEGNRVGISVDGVNLPESEENSLYALKESEPRIMSIPCTNSGSMLSRELLKLP